MGGFDSSANDPLDFDALEIVEEFERGWESGRPDIERYLDRHPGRPVNLLVELAAIDLENRLKRGEQATVEAYTARFPELAADVARIAEIDKVVARFGARRDGADPATEGDHAVTARAAGNLSGRDPLVGSEMGGVRIVRLIAQGGMGRVYEGRQQKPQRPVAVKFMRPGIASPSLLKRFDYEAQVLGRLRHPGIAQIHTVGTHVVDDQTVPYFVMEYVPNAQPLTQHAVEKKLSTHERLELFRKVCEAVAHGHQKGVIHRDLKPGNVLVDSSGQPKVIDFGLARSTDSDMTLTTMQTDVGALLGTLQYMSPEQFDADPNDLDIRLDVYALGVMLYELLTGAKPYDVKGRTIVEVARVVREEEPTPISNLDRTLRRDVATIASKCLQKDRKRRYSSATELAEDVSRYLAGEPITAAPPSFWDAVSRLARRHRAAASTVAGVAVSLVAAVVGISVFAVRAERARVEAEGQRVAAEEATAKAERARTEEERARAEAERQRASADEERDTAKRARAAEARQRSLAEAESTNAKQRLYAANLFRLDRMIADGLGPPVIDLFKETVTLVGGADPPLELRCLHAAMNDSTDLLVGHGDEVNGILFSPDGKLVASAGRDGSVRLWAAADGAPLGVCRGHLPGVVHHALSPDGSRLATGSKDGTARIWNTADGKELFVLRHPGAVYGVAFSSNGGLATACHDGAVRFWNVESGAEERQLKASSQPVMAFAHSPDGRKLVTASPDTTCRLWDVEQGTHQPLPTGHTLPVHAIVFSPDGRWIATASNDREVRVNDAETGESVAVLGGHTGPVTAALRFHPSGDKLVSGSFDGTLRVWDVAAGKPIEVLRGHRSIVTAAAYSADGTRLASAALDGSVRLWDVATGNPLATMRGHLAGVEAMAFSPDGKRLATGSNDRTVRLWVGDPLEMPGVLRGHTESVTSVAFAGDGRLLATGSDDGTARLWDVVTGLKSGALKGHRAGVTSVAFGPDGTRLVAGSRDGTAVLWDLATGKGLARLQGHRNWILGVAFSPDGLTIATASVDGTARLWDAELGGGRAVLVGHRDRIDCVAFSPDGKRLATGGGDNDRSVRIWDTATGACIAVVGADEHRRGVKCVAFSGDGGRLATGSLDGKARIFDMTAGGPPLACSGHTDWVTGIAFVPDETRLVTTSRDGTCRIWNAATGAELLVLRGHEGAVNDVSVGLDGRILATGGDDGTARLWGRGPAEIVHSRRARPAGAVPADGL